MISTDLTTVLANVLSRSTLDPLLERLARDFVDDADLSARLQSLFRVPEALALPPTLVSMCVL